jgi:hypothetical protein
MRRCGHGALLGVVVQGALCDDASTVGAHTANVLLEGQMSGPRALAALISSMKATKSIDGRFRVNVRVEFRVGIELAANGIASQLYDDLVDVEDVSSLGRRRLEGAMHYIARASIWRTSTKGARMREIGSSWSMLSVGDSSRSACSQRALDAANGVPGSGG